MQGGQQFHQRLHRVADRPAMPARMEILARPLHRDLERADPPAAGDDAGQVRPPLRAIGGQNEIGGQTLFVGFDKIPEMDAGHLLLALENKHHVDRQRALQLQKRLRHRNGDQHRALVVRSAPGIEAVAPDLGREGRRMPLGQRVWRLHVVMAVDQHRRAPRRAAPGCGDNGMARSGMDLDIAQTRLAQPRRDEAAARPDALRIGRIGRDAGDGGEGFQNFDVARHAGLQASLDGGCFGGIDHLPPSTDRVCPVIQPACSLARKSTAAATSAGVPRRRMAIRSTNAFWPSGP